MIKQADIVSFKVKGRSNQIGFVEKLFTIEGEDAAIIRWIKPASTQRTFAPVTVLKTLRSSKEAGQRGRKRVIPGLQEEGGVVNTVVFLDE